MLADVPSQEVVPYGTLEGISSVQEYRFGFRLPCLLNRRVEASEAPDARIYSWLAYRALGTNLVETK